MYLKNVCRISLLFLLFFYSCNIFKQSNENSKQEVTKWDLLIDEDLSEWDIYLSYQHQVGYDGTQPKDKNGDLISPIGLNKPGFNVFTVQKKEGETILVNSGEYYGCLITKKEYKNYHLQLKFKWGDKKWGYRKNLLKDSGVLYHSIGEMGVEYWRSWMLSQEFQIMEGHTGDFWSQANSLIDIKAYKPEGNLDPLAHKTQNFLPIGFQSPYKNYCRRSNNYENPKEDWNTIDLFCFEGKSIHMVNGKVVMILKNSRYKAKDGGDIPLIKGKIQIQSEAAEVFFKDVKIRPINSFTKEQKELYY